MSKDKVAFLLLCAVLTVWGWAVTSSLRALHNARQAEQSKTPEAPQLIVLEDKKRGATCYKLDWSDGLSCIPSQWLYNDAMYEGEGK